MYEDEVKWLSIGKAAKIIGVSTATLQNYERRGELVPEKKLVSGHRRYSQKQINDYCKMMRKGGMIDEKC